MNSLFRLFQRQRTPPTEWRSEKSIFDFISSNLGSDGKLNDNAYDLPDEKKADDKLKFAPGLIDAMFGADDSEQSANRVADLVRILKRIARTGNGSSEIEFHEAITSNENVIGIIDAFLTAIVEEELPAEPHLFSFARALATKSAHRNGVKFGIVLLGMCRNNAVVDELKILGLHDEFTVFSAIAIANVSDNAVGDLWQLARKVDGWGRIQLIDRLARLDLTDDVREWLIREGYKNSIMYEYLAFTCATCGLLHERLHHESIDTELFKTSGEIIRALINGGPAEDISNYLYASAVIQDYLRHAVEHTSDLSHFLTLHVIKDYLLSVESTSAEERGNQWTDDIISNCLIEAVQLLNSRDWSSLVSEGLKSDDNITYWNAKRSAEKLGIDLWDTVWSRLARNPVSSSAWYDVTHYAKPEEAEQIIQFAIDHLPLKDLATGPKDSLGLGPDYDKFQSLEYAITLLEDHPQKGEVLLLTGLNTPVTRIRNMSLRVLEKWTHVNWSDAIKRSLTKLHNLEPNTDTSNHLKRLLEVDAA